MLDDTIRELANQPPKSLALSPPKAEVEAANAAAKALLSPGREIEAFDTLARYEDFFPGNLGEELNTARGALVAAAGNEFAKIRLQRR